MDKREVATIRCHTIAVGNGSFNCYVEVGVVIVSHLDL